MNSSNLSKAPSHSIASIIRDGYVLMALYSQIPLLKNCKVISPSALLRSHELSLEPSKVISLIGWKTFIEKFDDMKPGSLGTLTQLLITLFQPDKLVKFLTPILFTDRNAYSEIPGWSA